MMSMNTNVSDDLDDIVNACMPSTSDVKLYDFAALSMVLTFTRGFTL